MSNIFTLSNCPVCNNNTFTDFLEVKDWLVSKEPYQIKECNSCGFRFTQDAPSQEHIAPYYNSEEYVEHSDTKSGLIYSLYHQARKKMLQYKLNKIKKLTDDKALLDIGSGSGYFLNHMKQNGYDVTGVEISDKAVALCKSKFGIDANHPSKFLGKELKGPFDIITLWHVFEHVYTYDEYFALFDEYLTKDGHLVVALPNCNSTDASFYKEHWAAYDVPRHLWHFTPDTFEKFASRRGFQLIKKHRLPLDSFFISMVSASYKSSFTFLPFTLAVGFASWFISLFDINRSSSLIYVLKKK
ncbi:MAG: class I SAM-dependent methyltransferase [Bacteroidia bacterium]